MRILVSGAGMAGLAAGINLQDDGHDVTIVERAQHLRTNGSPIDIRGEAIEIARTMGILQQIQDRRVSMTELTQFIDRDGIVIAELPGGEISDSDGDIEIPREDLASVLRGALKSTTSLMFGESIATLHDDGTGVEVTFTSGRTDRFDLVVGADGMHSATRGLTFGPESQYLRHLGFYVAITAMPVDLSRDRTNPILNWPGHMIGITRYNDTTLGVMTFRSEWIDYDYHDIAAQKRILVDRFGEHTEWRVPEILVAVRSTDELYFDSVSQIHMNRWDNGRVVLVGDAAHCASGLSGRGASLAILGTWHLASALREHPDDLDAAYATYHAAQRPHVVHAQASAGTGGDLVVPATTEDLDARNARLRTMTRD